MITNVDLKIAIISMIFGFLAGSIGVLVVLRKNALIGDSIAHAALPGVALSFLVFECKELYILLPGAALAALVAMVTFNFIKKHSKIKNDTILALILSGFFGLGIILIRIITNSKIASAAGLKDFIYGQASTMMFKDMITILIIFVIAYSLLLLLWKEFKVFIFNAEFAETLGFNNKLLNGIFSFLVVLVIIAGIQMLGVVLLSAMIIAPAVAIKQFSDKYHNNFIFGGVIGAVSGFCGSIISSLLKIPTGPSIIVFLSLVVLLSLLFAPKKGLVFNHIKHRLYIKKVEKLNLLLAIYKKEVIYENSRTFNALLTDGYIVKKDKIYIISERGLQKIRMISETEEAINEL